MSEIHEAKDRLYNIEDLECLLDSIPFEVCLKDKDGKLVYINKKGAEKIGLSKEKIIGKEDKDFKSKEIFDKCQESDRKILETGDCLFYEKQSYNNNELNRIYKFPIKDENNKVKFIGTYTEDITCKKNIGIQLKKLFIENKLDKDKIEYIKCIEEILNNLNCMMDSTSVHLFLVDKETHNLKKYLSSDKCDRLFFNDAQVEIDYKTLSDIYYENLDLNVDSRLNEEFKKKYIRDYNISYNSKLRIFPLKYKSDVIGMLYVCYEDKSKCTNIYDGNIMDICEQMAMMIAILEYNNDLRECLNSYKTENRTLQDKNKKLEEAIGAEMIKINFLENMSHEFRTPINIILMTSQLLISLLERDINEIDKEKIINHLKTLRQNGYRILRLVNNILDTTKFDNNLERLKLGNYNIVGLIEDIVLSTSEYIQNRQIILNKEEEELISACNPDAIEKIILNLVSNSLKFTNEGGKIEVDIKVDHQEEKLFVYLRNNGPSISKEYSQKIFDRFVQTDNNLRRVSEGSGIGLYLVKLLVEMHEGEIWLNTEVEEGVEFVFYIPIKTIDSIDDITLYNIEEHTIIDKCRIEFSDVYSI